MNYMIDRGFCHKEHEGLRKERKGLNSTLCGFFAPVAVNCLNCDSCDYNDFYDSGKGFKPLVTYTRKQSCQSPASYKNHSSDSYSINPLINYSINS